MTTPLDPSAMDRLVANTLKALHQARGQASTSDASNASNADPEPLRGTGTAADGLIRIEALPGGRLAGLDIDPRAMRMDSISLAEEILAAANTALADLQERLRAGIGGPDLNALAEQRSRAS